MFGTMGGCALVGTSMINIKSGGRHRLSSFSAAATVLVTILAAYRLINLVPVGSLAGVMFMIVIHTIAWPSMLIITSSLVALPVRNDSVGVTEYVCESRVCVRMVAPVRHDGYALASWRRDSASGG